MRVHIHFGRQGWPHNVNHYLALDGFQQMGWEIVPYTDEQPLRDHAPDEVVVGHIAAVQAGLRALGRPVPAQLDYPAVLQPWLGRRIWPSTINAVAAQPEGWPVFVKPLHDGKKFTGVLVRRVGDLVGCGDQHLDTPVWCAKPVQFRAEWRCFVRYGQVLPGAPAAFALDVGVTTAGATLVVEVNDAYALGAYGLSALAYAKLMSARWAQLTGTEDYCNF